MGGRVLELICSRGSVLSCEVNYDILALEGLAFLVSEDIGSCSVLSNNSNTCGADVTAYCTVVYGKGRACNLICICAVYKACAADGNAACVALYVNDNDTCVISCNVSKVAAGACLLGLARKLVVELVNFGNRNALVGCVDSVVAHLHSLVCTSEEERCSNAVSSYESPGLYDVLIGNTRGVVAVVGVKVCVVRLSPYNRALCLLGYTVAEVGG